MDLEALIEKAAALAGKLGKQDLQEKLLQIAKEAGTAQQGFAEEWKRYDEPSAPKEKMSSKDQRAAIWEGLREASLDPRERKGEGSQIGMY